jgi:hypothetical protein
MYIYVCNVTRALPVQSFADKDITADMKPMLPTHARNRPPTPEIGHSLPNSAISALQTRPATDFLLVSAHSQRRRAAAAVAAHGAQRKDERVGRKHIVDVGAVIEAGAPARERVARDGQQPLRRRRR